MTQTALRITALLLLTVAVPHAARAQGWPTPAEGDFVATNFRFESGETLPEVKLHYRTLGTPRKDADGVVRNGVLILHGTSGSGRGFLNEAYAGRLFGPGQLLDAGRYYIILPDNIGHGQSSKPSDGLRMKFPRYGYRDMVKLQHLLVTQGLGLSRLRLIMGTSMGGMHTWMWGYLYPDFMDGLVPLASNPVEIAGRNRLWRKALVDAIVTDPSWKDGNYTEPPRGMASAIALLLIAGSAPLQWQARYPTALEADRYLAEQIEARTKTMDANDMIYYFRASQDYDPAPHLERITAPLLAINSADDMINPPELPMMQEHMKRVKRGRFVLIPISDQTRGHGTHSQPDLWRDELERFLAETEQQGSR
ncbi:MAG TPA: alpha/beta fold hydrolase [Vicinamibacterales bacterium]|nr:alpha/beta fold hydrolase [Vicinamibacterales bacterium]